VTALLEDVANELGVTDAGSEPTVRLQEHVAGSGYTDVEVRTSEMHDVVVTTTFEGHVPGFSGELDDPYYVYTLGPPITPAETIRSGKVTRALRVWAALDLLLTSKTISDARDRTAERLAAAGQ
jgi:hypothetical protein